MLCSALILTVMLLAVRGPDPVDQQPLPGLLARAGAYVDDYQRRLTAIVAEEQYVQRVHARSGAASDAGSNASGTITEERTLRSDFMLLRGISGEDAWVAFRDIFEVDGRPVTGARGRLETWLADSTSGFMHRARALALEQARYNIGPVVRTINVPTLGLEILAPDNQARFRFRGIGTANVEGLSVSLLSFEERRRPTMIRTPGGRDVVARGRLWIETATGRVARTELRTGERERTQVNATIVVDYALDPRLGMLLPQRMHERYVAGHGRQIVCTATYSNFRRFETDARIIR